MIAEESKYASFQRFIQLLEASDVSTGVPIMVPYKKSKRLDLDAVDIFDLRIAQDRGLKFYQSDRFSIILYNTMPTEALPNVLKYHRNHS